MNFDILDSIRKERFKCTESLPVTIISSDKEMLMLNESGESLEDKFITRITLTSRNVATKANRLNGSSVKFCSHLNNHLSENGNKH